MHRLLFICPDVFGGVRSYITNLTAYLGRAGVGHAVLFYGSGNKMTTAKSPGEIPYSTRICFSNFASPRSIYEEFAGLVHADDILICSDSLELEVINYKKLANRTIFILHGDLEHYHTLLGKREHLLDHVFCVSNGLRQKYSRLYTHPGFSVCHPLVADFTVNREYSRDAGLVAVFIGRFEYMKGADVFVEVVNEAAEKQIPIRWKAFVVSKGSKKELIAEIPEQVDIVYDLANEKVLTAIEDADLLLFPSRSEGFGIVVLEAMKRGVVPIARNLPIGIPDMITDKVNGFLADEAQDMLKIIEDLSKDRQKLGKIGLEAYRSSNKAFNYEKTGRNFVAKVEEVLMLPVKNKLFTVTRSRNMERLLPEPVYRCLKWLHNTIKYGRRAGA
jgi:glycosyltransferase involved in cell wall biosynthesis